MLAPLRLATFVTTDRCCESAAPSARSSERRLPLGLAALLVCAVPSAAAAASNDEALVRSLAGGTAGTLGVPRLAVEGSVEVGKPFGLRLEGARPGSVALVATSAPAPAVPVAGTLATLHVGAPLASLAFVALDAAGRSPALFATPSLAPALCGIEVHAQAAVLDPLAATGIAYSAGARLRIGLDDGGPLFEQRTYASAGGSTSAVRLGDMDGDGVLDLVLASRGAPLGTGSDVAIHRGRADGTFDAPLVLDVGTVPADLALADLDGDARLDVVVANSFDDSVSVVLRTAAGGYAPPVEHAVGFGPRAVVAADLDGDGVIDLAAAVAGNALLPQRHVGVLRGVGGGAFAPVAFHEVGREPLALEVADLDGDGVLDLATASPLDGIGVLRGLAAGGFEPVAYLAAGSAPRAARAADLDGDGRQDLVVANAGSGDVSVLLGLPGGFAAPQHVPAAAGPQNLRVVDVDRDGILDVLVVARDTDELVVLRGLGTGAFQAPTAIAVGDEPCDIASADLDGDGRLDLAVGSAAQGDAVVLLGSGGGTFLAPTVLPSLGWLDLAADLDLDGDLDIVTIGGTSAHVRLQQAGAFTTVGAIALGTDIGGATLGDANADGRVDLVVSRFAGNAVTVLLGAGDGTFPTTFDVATHTNAAAVALADVDGDGLVDLAVGTRGPASVSLPGVSVHLASAPGVFGGPVHTWLAGQPLRSLEFADVDGDGVLDVVLASDAIVGFSRGLGDGTFEAWSGNGLFMGFSGIVTGLAVRDLDDDGHLDLLWCEFADAQIFVYRGDGTDVLDWSRLAWFSTDGLGRPTDLEACDVDGDGRLDIVAAMLFEDAAVVYRGLGGGAFAPAQSFARGGGALVARDFDGDDAPDLFLGGRLGPALLLRNQRYR